MTSHNPARTISLMDHTDHVNLLRKGIETPGGTWADFGAGTGAFTLALAGLIGPDGEIHAVDTNAGSLRTLDREMRARFPASKLHCHVADFTRPLALPLLDGIVMANSLHFQKHQDDVVRLLRSYLGPAGRLLVVEYNIAHGNSAVPHPVPFSRWQELAHQAGFQGTTLLATRPSRFLTEIYSALST
jgi:ubiquinone/menaquinone biosynthesis C-methylase UbiE